MSSNQTLFVGIAGGTGSGKTTLVQKIIEHFTPESVSMICLDSYYKELGHLTAEERSKENFDAPSAVDLVLLHAHLKELYAGRAIDVPIYDFSLHTRAPKSERVEVKQVVILEGILALHDPEIREILGFKIFLDVDSDTRFQRRMSRDVRERGRTEESVHWQWNATVQPMYLEYCEPSRSHADLILSESDDWSEAFREIERRLALKKQQAEPNKA